MFYKLLQTSPDGNVTLSVIQYVPSVRDAGKYMSCRAENPELPESSLEDGWKLIIHCEYCFNHQTHWGGTSGRQNPPVDLDLGCSTILPGLQYRVILVVSDWVMLTQFRLRITSK